MPDATHHHPFADAITFTFRKRRQNMQLKLPRRGRAVDALVQRHEGDPKLLEFIDNINKMSKISSEPIEAPANDGIEAASACVFKQSVKAGR